MDLPLQRIAQCGGFLATAEMILFQLSCSSKVPSLLYAP